MTKTHRKAATTAEDAFNRHYAGIWGEERWTESLYPALLQPTRYACLLNRYTLLNQARDGIEDEAILTLPLEMIYARDNDGQPETIDSKGSSRFIRCKKQDSQLDGLLPPPSDASFPPPRPATNGLFTHWNLDAASLLVADMLNVQPGDYVLDLCAAPGGKSIALAENLFPHFHCDASIQKQRSLEKVPLRNGVLHSNEADGPRQRRLAENLKLYLPTNVLGTSQVTALRVDASKPNAEYEFRVKTPSGTVGYDKVLVDAPCSSERHIIHAHAKATASGRTADEMTNWRPGSSKRLASTQLDLLMTGLKAAKIGGIVAYATCSIEPTENDGVIEKMLAQVEKDKKKGSKWEVKVGLTVGDIPAIEQKLESFWAEKTKYGWLVLPDHPSGGKWGPLFFTILTKLAVS